MSRIATSYSPNGSTVALSSTATSSFASVGSITPTNAWYCVNTGANPVAIRFYVSASTGTAIFPTVGSPQLGPVLAAGDAQVFELPGALANGNALGGFTSTVLVATIATTGTNPVYITPLL